MKKLLRKRLSYFFYFFIAVLFNEAKAQNIFSGEPVQVVGQFNGYSTTPYNSDYRTCYFRRISVPSGNPTDGRGQWCTNINVQSSGGQVTPINMSGGGGAGFLFISGPSSNRFQNKWVFSGVGQGSLNAINGISAFNSGNDMGLNMSTPGRYTFVFNDCGYTQTNAKYYVGYTANNPVTAFRTGQTFVGGQPVVSITTSATPSSGENVYVRYRVSTNDFTTGTSVVQASGSGTSWSATLPAQTCGSTVYYYVYTSTRTLAQIATDSESDRSLAVLLWDDNAGANYSFTVAPSTAAVISGTNAICAGLSSNLQVAITGGASPYSLVYTDGTSNFTVNNYTSGANIAVSPSVSKTYTIVSVTDANGCVGSGNSGAATVTVNPLPTATIAGDTTVCQGATNPLITFTALTGTAPFTFTYKINNGSDQTISFPSGNTASVSASTVASGTTVYTLVSVQDSSTTACSNLQSGTATVNITAGTTYYDDTDGDSYGNPALTAISCSGAPTGYVTNNTDCAPSDPTKWRTGNFYTDADNDGYNNGAPQSPVCYGSTIPLGYTSVNLGTDCADDNAAVNPNHVEVLGNGIDDNCDGNIDEVTPLSNLVATSCGVTLANLSTTLFAYALTNSNPAQVQGYRFEVTNGATVRTYESTTNSFTLLNLAGGAAYATTYSIRVSIKSAGFWRAYGSACSVTTPAVPASTYISSPSCGSTLADISNTIFCNAVASATGYRFEVSDGVTTRTFDTTVNRFSLLNLVGGANFGTAYSIRVLLQFGGVWRPDTEYGPSCTINSPATPATSRVINPACGSTISNIWTTIYAQQVVGAQGYKFHVTNGAQTRDVITANPRFQLPQLPGGAAANTVYTIRVDVLYNLSYVQGTQTCTITTSPTASRQTATALDIYEVKAYPNPFADNFKLDINTSSEDTVGVKVYDMLGRSIESREASVSDMTNLAIGDRYPTGVYNIVITQGDHVKTLRVIKR